MRLSVIIPTYNTAVTLPRCVESVAKQNVDDMEIIIVNDGSTDETPETINLLARMFPQVKGINQQNKGLSAARNIGIEHSTGDLITFVDSDDWVQPDTYKPLLDMMYMNPECDILEFSLRKKKPNGRRENVTLKNNIYDSPIKYWLDGNAYRHTYAWNKIFRRTQFFGNGREKVRFPEGKVFEDIALMSQILTYSPRIMTTSLVGYNYEWNPQGITKNAKGEGLTLLLNSHIDIARQLKLQFMDPNYTTVDLLDEREVDLYMTILNIQISVYRFTKQPPILPRVRIHAGKRKKNTTEFTKTLMLNAMGVEHVCKMYSLLNI